MAEQPIIYQTPKIETENGKNADRLIGFETHPSSAKFQGTGSALGPILAELGYETTSKKKIKVPGRLDDIAVAGESDEHTILERRNFVNQMVPKRFDEYIEDRQDAALGSLWDYFIGPGLKIIGFYKAGVDSNEVDAYKFIDDLDKRYPTGSAEIEASMYDMGYDWTGSGWKKRKSEPITPSVSATGAGDSSYEQGIEGGIGTSNLINDSALPVNRGDPKKVIQENKTTIYFYKQKND